MYFISNFANKDCDITWHLTQWNSIVEKFDIGLYAEKYIVELDVSLMNLIEVLGSIEL